MNTNTNDILEPETNMFWTSHGHGYPQRSRISCASLTTPQHSTWDADYAFTADDLRAMVQRLLDAEQRGEAATMKTCWQIEEDYADIVAPIAHLRTGSTRYEVQP